MQSDERTEEPSGDFPSALSVTLHWVAAIAVLSALSGGLLAVYFSPMCCSNERWTSFAWHAYFGLLVLFIVVIRLVFWAAFTWPKVGHGGFRPTEYLASVTHWLLYLIMIMAPLSGWIAASGMPCCFGLPGVPHPQALSQGVGVRHAMNASAAYDVHVALVWSLLALILLHVAAALLHHFVIGDKVLAKMLPGRRAASW